MKRQNDRILKEELLRSVGAQHTTGEITPERMKGWSQSKNNKLQYFGHLMQRADSLERTLMLGGIGGRRRRGRQRMRWLDGITDSMDVSLNSRTW